MDSSLISQFTRVFESPISVSLLNLGQVLVMNCKSPNQLEQVITI